MLTGIRLVYIIAALQHNKALIWASVPGRAAAALIFWRYGGVWRNVAIFEALCGGLVVAALGWEAVIEKRGRREERKKED